MNTTKRLLALNLVLLLLLTLIPFSAFAEDIGVAVDAINFPDDAFRAYVSEECDTDGNGYLSDEEISNVTSIAVDYCSIASLDGIGYFAELQALFCFGNDLTELPELPSKLTYLNCVNNRLTKIPQLPDSLTSLECSLNRLLELPELPDRLITLNCNWNDLKTLPKLPDSIRSLSCAGNSFEAIPVLPNGLTELSCGSDMLKYVSELPGSLESFECNGYNTLEQLPELPDSLTYLKCSGTALKVLPRLPNSLKRLELDNNYELKVITELPEGLVFFSSLGDAVTELPELPNSLTGLNCDDGVLESLPKLPDSVVSLSCRNNKLTAIELNPSAEYTSIYVGGNHLPDREAVTGQHIEWDDQNFIFGEQDHEHVLTKHGAAASYITLGCENCDYNENKSLCNHNDGTALDENNICSICGTLKSKVDENGEFSYINTDNVNHLVTLDFEHEKAGYYYTVISDNAWGGEIGYYSEQIYTTPYDLVLWDDNMRVYRLDGGEQCTLSFSSAYSDDGYTGEYKAKVGYVEPIEITEPGTYSFDGENDIYNYHIYTKEPKCAHIIVNGEASILCKTSGSSKQYDNNEVYVDLSGGTRDVSVLVNASDAGEIIVSFEDHDLEITNKIDPTCDEYGSTLYVCRNCGGQIYESYEPIGHTFNDNGLCTRCDKYTCQSKNEPEKHVYDENGVCMRCGEALPEPLKLENGAVYRLSADGVLTVYDPDGGWDNFNAVCEYFKNHIQNVRKIVYENGTINACMYYAENVEEIYLGATVQSFESMGYYNLAKIDVSKDNPNFSVADDVVYNKDKTVLVRYPAAQEGVNFDIPDSVTKIEEVAFDGSKLESIYIPDSVTEIEGEAFRRCEELKSIKLSNNLTTIYYLTFDSCRNLEMVIIPSSVKRIESYAFPFCSKLADIYYTGTEEQWNAIEFDNWSADGWGPEVPSSVTIHYNYHEHITELRNAVEPTCTEDGYTGDEVCTVCGEVISQGETIDATGHHYDGKVCTDCGHKMSAGETIQIWFKDAFQNIKNFFDKIFGRH